jgi:hypothetical protein
LKRKQTAPKTVSSYVLPPPRSPEQQYQDARRSLVAMLDYWIARGTTVRVQMLDKIQQEAKSNRGLLSALSGLDRNLPDVGGAALAEQLRGSLVQGTLVARLRQEIDRHVIDLLGARESGPYHMTNAVSRNSAYGQGAVLAELNRAVDKITVLMQQHGFADSPWSAEDPQDPHVNF